MKWKTKSWKSISDEFNKLADSLVRQGDTEVLTNLVPFNIKKRFVIEWHKNDKLDY